MTDVNPGTQYFFQLVQKFASRCKLMDQLILEVISKHVEERKVTRSGKHGFTKGKRCLTNPIALCDGATGWVDEGRAVGAVCLGLSKALHSVSHDIPRGQPRQCGWAEGTVRGAENGLNGRAEGAVTGGAEPSWRPVARGVPQGQCWLQSCSTYSPATWTEGPRAPSAPLLVGQTGRSG